MPYGQTSYMDLTDFSTGYAERLDLAGAIKFCVRPQAALPQWLLIATDAGEIRVFNEAGVHQSGYDIDLGWNPDQVTLNNEDTPKILILRLSTETIYLYEMGAESWNVAGITDISEAMISDGWVHTLISTASAATSGTEWRNHSDGAINQGVRGVSPTLYYKPPVGMCITEAGEAVYYHFVAATGAGTRRDYFRKEDRTAGVVWTRLSTSSSSTPTAYRSACSADGGLVAYTYYEAYQARTYFVLRTGTNQSVASIYQAGTNRYRFKVNPAGTRAIVIHSTTLRKYESDGTTDTVVTGAAHAANYWCVDVSDDPHYVCLLGNGDIEIYDDALALKATIDYGLANSPIAVVRRVSP